MSQIGIGVFVYFFLGGGEGCKGGRVDLGGMGSECDLDALHV